MPAATSQRNYLPTRALALLCLGIALTALALWGQSVWWTCALCLGSAAARCVINVRRLSLPPLPVRLLILITGLSAVMITYRSLLGAGPGFGILLILVALKLLESNHARDFHVLALLGYFLALSDLFFGQELGRWLIASGAVFLITVALVEFHQGEQRTSWPRAVRLAGKMLAQALPLIVLLFVFFPRVRGEFRLLFANTFDSATGMTDKLAPGSLASLAIREDVAFRATFPDGHIPQSRDLYWRGLTLWQGRGLNWSRGEYLNLGASNRQFSGPQIHQRILLEPHGDHWLYALDRPVAAPPHSYFDASGALMSFKALTTRRQYDVVSQQENAETTLSERTAQVALTVPKRVSPEVLALAAKLQAGAASPQQIINRGLEFFRRGGFTYSLSPGTYESPALDEFLFKRRTGFCEHYAAAFATLMRLTGTPARVVVGYLGGEYSDYGDYVIVRQSDAHAWCEVWIKDQGWLRVDPTSVVAPARLSAGLQDYLESRQERSGTFAGSSSSSILWRTLWRSTSLFWDNLSFQWNLRVLGYDQETQRSVLVSMGLGTLEHQHLALVLGVIVVLLLTLQALWLIRVPKSAGDPARRWYDRFCRSAAAAGTPREPTEGPLQFTRRLAREFPAAAEQILKVGTLYAAARYGRKSPPWQELAAAIRATPRGWNALVARPRRRHSSATPFLMSLLAEKNYAISQLDTLDPHRCPCGWSRRAFSDVPEGPATVHVVEIESDSRTHYHKTLTEIYVILEGEGFLELDGETIPVRPLTSIMIRPGCRHRAIGKLKVLNIPIPKFDPEDEWFD